MVWLCSGSLYRFQASFIVSVYQLSRGRPTLRVPWSWGSNVSMLKVARAAGSLGPEIMVLASLRILKCSWNLLIMTSGFPFSF